VLEKLREHKVYEKISRCEFWLREDAFLGHVLSEGGVSIDLGKVKDVLDWDPLQNVFDICNFLDLAGYYRRFIQDFSKIAKLMTRLLEKGKEFKWLEEC
jgi:hypothetical protein